MTMLKNDEQLLTHCLNLGLPAEEIHPLGGVIIALSAFHPRLDALYQDGYHIEPFDTSNVLGHTKVIVLRPTLLAEAEARGDGLIVKVDKQAVGDPKINIWHIEIYSQGDEKKPPALWEETVGSEELRDAFLQGVRAGAAMLGVHLPYYEMPWSD